MYKKMRVDVQVWVEDEIVETLHWGKHLWGGERAARGLIPRGTPDSQGRLATTFKPRLDAFMGGEGFSPILQDSDPERRLVFVPRAGWKPNLRLPLLGNAADPQKWSKVVIHHTVTVDRDATPNVWEDMDSILSMMRRLQVIRDLASPGMPSLGADVPYNFVVFCGRHELVICEGRGTRRTGAHAKGHNSTSLGIAFAGDFENREAPETLELDFRLLREWVSAEIGGPFGRTFSLVPHSVLAATACPGKHLLDALRKTAVYGGTNE